uniref:Uncharacterized protein n=1 Tax=Anser cygnoides TaxID=8845 RepID=A0A8B9IHV4_ANSCY
FFPSTLEAVLLSCSTLEKMSETGKLLPGPFPLPFIGNMLQLKNKGRSHVYNIFLGTVCAVVLYGPDVVKEFCRGTCTFLRDSCWVEEEDVTAKSEEGRADVSFSTFRTDLWLTGIKWSHSLAIVDGVCCIL